MRILLCYDGFPHSQHALEEAVKLAKDAAAEITILSVVPRDARATRTGVHVGLKPHAHEDVAVAHAYLRERAIEAEMKIAYGEPGLFADRGGQRHLILRFYFDQWHGWSSRRMWVRE